MTMITLPSREVKSLSSMVNSVILLEEIFLIALEKEIAGRDHIISSSWSDNQMIYKYRTDVRLLGRGGYIFDGELRSPWPTISSPVSLCP